MGLVSLGLFSNTIQGITGSILLMIAHGLVSPALFIIVTCLYDRYKTRILKYYRGITVNLPIFSIFFFLFSLANMAVPLTGNFIGEFLIFLGSFIYQPIFVGIAGLSMILVAGYSIWFYNRIAFGKPSLNLEITNDLTRREFFLLLPLLILTIILGIFPNIICEPLNLNLILLIN
jgi:NADH-ubiquinone oxidoreductase chain 4